MDRFRMQDENLNRYEALMDRYIESRERTLLMHLLTPRSGERILALLNGRQDIQNDLKDHGCQLTVIDYPEEAIRSGAGAPWVSHEDLVFSDNEFDTVIVMSSLGYTRNPARLVSEAIRVSRERVFLGIDNRHSLIGAKKRIDQSFIHPAHVNRLFTIRELKKIVREILGGQTEFQWGSVLFLPYGWYRYAASVEESIPFIGNPFGAFMGLSFPVVFRYRTIQQRITPFQLGIKPQEFTGSVRRDQVIQPDSAISSRECARCRIQ